MKRFIASSSIFLFLLFTASTITAVAQPKIYSQGFYSLKDLGLLENVSYNVQNNEPYVKGLVIIIDTNQDIQQVIKIQPNSSKNPLIPLKNDYKFIISGNVKLTFS
ncbi:hypothetical protein CDLVIII_3937 [Clostridium sp. DL-VIII]|uniref:hypothetical protein n=1 Tax=Clostridium sp. DL-VIII TaxID=641107 RepID=UPI00023B0130|nr:hypothetical protein [Clostridium sp. DL-VIII]EHJ00479.1 hypothetical protein CDLVIII_3937 [Clostridium sp. DL-VIII]